MVSSSGFTDDILIEIFTYLPLNSIYKFKCLSKVWLSNLSNPNFITKWFKINSKSLPWIQYHPNTDHDSDENPMKFKMACPDLHSEFMSRNEHLFSFQFLLNEKPVGAKLFLFGCSNGLVLCSVQLNLRQTYHVCNPLTQNWVSLPSPPRSPISDSDVNGIFCEYSSSSASRFKVVRIPKFGSPSKKFIIDIFSSDLGVWESFQVSCDEDVKWPFSGSNNVVILNGVLYWQIEWWNRLLIYNLNQNNGSDGHRCSLIHLPDEELDYTGICNLNNSLGESEGWVCYAETNWTGREMSMGVWVLDEVNWRILHKDIPVGDIFAELRSHIGRDTSENIQVLGFSPVDRNVVLLSWMHMVWEFNFQTRTIEELWGFSIHNRSVEEICLDKRRIKYLCGFFRPFVLKPMPTVLPLPSWKDTA